MRALQADLLPHTTVLTHNAAAVVKIGVVPEIEMSKNEFESNRFLKKGPFKIK